MKDSPFNASGPSPSAKMQKMPPITLCIVMPAYNEQACIDSVIRSWLGFLQRKFSSGEGILIVVNDGSKDRTGDILDSLAREQPALKVVHQENQGHGSALITGYRAALDFEPQWIFQTDSDDQFLPSDFDSLWVHRDESKFITGYRRSRHDAFHRLLITRIVRMLNFGLYGCYIRDANVPYRLIRGSYLKVLLGSLPTKVFAPNIFLTVLAAKDGQKLFEIPISHQQRKTGVVSILRWKLIKVCWRSAIELSAFRLSLGSARHAIRCAQPND